MAKIILNVDLNAKTATDQLNKLRGAVELIADHLSKMTPNKDLTDQLNALAKSFNALARQAAQVEKSDRERAALTQKLAKLEADTAKAEAQRAKAVSDVAKAAAQAATAVQKEKEATEKANLAQTKAKEGVEKLAIAVEKRKQAEEKTNQEAAKTLIQEEKLELQAAKTAAGIEQLSGAEESAAQATDTLGMKFGNLVERYAKFYASSLLVRKPLQLIQNALSEVGETLVKTEDAVIEINRVLDDPQPTQEVSNRLYNLAYQYGSTFENASTIASNFARAGRSWNDSLKATEAALLAMNVAELNATEASDGLLSIIAQFDMEASDLIDVVDKLNKTADKNPVSTQKLLQAIQRAGSAAKNANVSFDQTLGLITAISEATNRSGQNIGTAINSLIQYSTKHIDDFRDLSEESNEMVEKFKLGLASIVDVWNQVSIDIRNDKELRDSIIESLGTDDLEELSSTLHDELGDLVSEIDGVYNVANTYRKNYFIALLDNMDRFMKVQEQLDDYQGYSQEENKKYMETYTAKVNQLNDAWQKLANDEQGILKFKKDLAEIGISLVDFVDQTGGVIDAVKNIAGIVGGLTLIAKAEELRVSIGNIGTTLKATLSGAEGAFQTTIGWIGALIAISSILNTTINTIRTSQEERRKETLKEFDANKENITSLKELKDKYDKGNLSLKDSWELEEKIVPLLGDKKIALDNLAEHTEEYTKKVWELVEGLREEQKLLAQQTQDVAKDNYIEAARKALEDSARAQAKRDGGVQSFILNSQLGSFYTSVFSTAMNDAEEAAEYLDKVRERLEKAKQEYLDARNADVSDAELKKKREYYEDLLKIFNDLNNARETYEKERREGLIAELEATENLTDAQKSQLLTLKAINEQHIVGRAGVVPNLEEIKEKTKHLGETASETADALEENADALIDVSDAAEEDAEILEEIETNIKNLSAEISDVKSSLSLLNTVQEEYNEFGSLSIDTLQKLIDAGADYVALIVDEEGQIRLNEDAVNDLIDAKSELLNQLIAEQVQEYAVNKLHEYMAQSTADMGDEAVTAAQKIELAALALAHFEGNEEGAKRAAEDFEEALHRLALAEGVYFEDWEENWVSDVVNFRSNLSSLYAHTDTSRSGWERSSGPSKTTSSSSSKSEKDEYLESLKDAVSLRESELTLMQHQGASQDAQIAKIHEIQAAIHDEAEYMRSIGASQEEINKLSSEWWKWQEKINKFAEDNAKAAEKAAEEAKKAAEEQKKAEEEAIKAETARLKQILANDKAKLNLMQKQGKSVSEQVEMMKKIQEHLHDEAEWLRKIKAEQADIDALSAEWWDWQEKILQLYKETLETQKQIELDGLQKIIDGILEEIDLQKEQLDLENKQLAVKEAEEALEKAIIKAKTDYIQNVLSTYLTSLSDAETLEEKQLAVQEARAKLAEAEREAKAKSIIETFKAEKEVKSDTLSLEEKRLAVEQARQALYDAEHERTTKVFNEATGQWEFQANAKNVQSAQDNLAKAIDALNSYVEEAAWNEVAEAVEQGSVSEEEVLQILAKWSKEAYGNDTPEFVTKIQAAFRKAMGSSASPDSVSGQISAVDNAVKSLNDYLKQQAVKELKSYIAAGNTDTDGMKRILDHWLSVGEGGELYQWRDGLLNEISGAIESGYYDDEAVQSQIQGVENAIESLHDYLRNQFVREVSDLAKNGTAEQISAAIEKWSNAYEMSDVDRDWAERLAGAKASYDQAEGAWDSVLSGNTHSDEEKQRIIAMMKANSAAWFDAEDDEKQRLADINYALGTSMGWHRKENGAWYDENDNRVYDKGGVLWGSGAIKATNRPEIVLDPELTAKILRPGSEAQFRAFADAMHLMFERGDRSRTDSAIVRSAGVSDSHNTSYTINGIPIGAGAAERYTIAELFRMMPTARA